MLNKFKLKTTDKTKFSIKIIFEYILKPIKDFLHLFWDT